jgi:hypothetical protein
MRPAGFEPAIPRSGRPQTHVLNCATTGFGCKIDHISSKFTKYKYDMALYVLALYDMALYDMALYVMAVTKLTGEN